MRIRHKRKARSQPHPKTCIVAVGLVPSDRLLGFSLFTDPSCTQSSLFVQQTGKTAHPQGHRKHFILEAEILAHDVAQLPSQQTTNKSHPTYRAGGCRTLLPLLQTWHAALGASGAQLWELGPICPSRMLQIPRDVKISLKCKLILKGELLSYPFSAVQASR